MRLSRWFAVLSLGILGLALATFKSDERGEPGIEELVAALGSRRPIEPRLTGGFGYAPCKAVTEPGRMLPRVACSPLPSPGSDEYKTLTHALPKVQKQNKHTRGLESEALHVNGITGLLWPSSGEAIDASIASLEAILEKRPGNARLLSDLAAAYLVRAQFRDDPYDLMLALVKADEAVAADPELAEARFNQALALERLFLRESARSAWQEYLRLDPDSAWASEAQERYIALKPLKPAEKWGAQKDRLREAAERREQELVERIVRRNRQAAREFAEQQLLGEWAEAYLASDPVAAEEALQAARDIGAALAAINGDRLVEDAVAAIDEPQKDLRRLKTLAEGHLAFRDGYQKYKGSDTTRAVERLREAEEALRSAGSPFAGRAAFWRGCAEYHLDHYRRADTTFEELQQEVRGKPYPSLLAHTFWMRGLIRLVLGDPVGSLSFYQSAVQGFAGIGEAENATTIQNLIAESLDHLGRYREAWSYRYKALREAQSLRDPTLIYIAFAAASHSALRQEQPSIALHLQDELIRRISPSKDPELLSEAFFWLALMQERAGDSPVALISLAQARQFIYKIPDEVIRRDAKAGTDLMEGSILSNRNPQRAVDLLSRALAIYTKTGHHLLSLIGYQERGRAYRQLGEMTLAEDDLQAGIQAYEKLGEKISVLETKLSFLHRVQDAFDEIIGFEATERKDAEMAFDFADRIRTKSLLSSIMGLKMAPEERKRLLATEEDPLGLTNIRQNMPEKTVLVQYTVLEDRLLTWVILADRKSQFFQSEIPHAKLRQLVRAIRANSEGGGEVWNKVSYALHDILLTPWEQEVHKEERIVFIPDKELNSLPFACLLNRSTGRFLIEDHIFTIGPSATIFIDTEKEISRLIRKEELLSLVVGDPAFNRSSFPELFRLPAAKQEATRVASFSPAARLLIGSWANKKAFITLAPQASQIHFAGHSVLNDRNPLESLLLFAPTGENSSGALYAREIYQLDLSNTRMVVLSSCDSSNDFLPQGEGIVSLARAFMAAGAPTVIGALWKVDDQPTADFFSTFYQRLAVNGDPASTLRAVQLEFLRGRTEDLRRPSTWGTFEVMGASAQER
jgi:CHAT domain-containing protein